MFCIRLNSSIKISHTVNMKDDVVNSQMCVWVFFTYTYHPVYGQTFLSRQRQSQ